MCACVCSCWQPVETFGFPSSAAAKQMAANRSTATTTCAKRPIYSTRQRLPRARVSTHGGAVRRRERVRRVCVCACVASCLAEPTLLLSRPRLNTCRWRRRGVAGKKIKNHGTCRRCKNAVLRSARQGLGEDAVFPLVPPGKVAADTLGRGVTVTILHAFCGRLVSFSFCFC